MKKFFFIYFFFICFVGFSDEDLIPELASATWDGELTSLNSEVFLHNYRVLKNAFDSVFNISASCVSGSDALDYSKGVSFQVGLYNGNEYHPLANCWIEKGKRSGSSNNIYNIRGISPGIYSLVLKANSGWGSSNSVRVTGGTAISYCPNMSDCSIETCNVCNGTYCIFHQPHLTRCFQCVNRNYHCHCSNSEGLLDVWEEAARETTLCPSCGGQVCGLCTHQCFDAFCPNLDSCNLTNCSICGSEYCATHVFHLCSNYTEYGENIGGIISSQTSIHGSADVSVNIDTEGLSSAISGLGSKIDESNENLSGIRSDLSSFNQDFRQGNLFLTQRMDYMMGQFDGIGTGIGDLNTGVGDLNTGVGTLNEGVGDLNEGLTDVGESLDGQTGILQDIKDSLVGGSPIASGTIDGVDFVLPDFEDEYEYDLDLTFFDRLREKLAFPSGYFSFSSSDDLLFEFPLEVFDHDFSFSIDFNDPVLNPLRSKVRAVSSFLMVFVFSMSIFKTISLW